MPRISEMFFSINWYLTNTLELKKMAMNKHISKLYIPNLIKLWKAALRKLGENNVWRVVWRIYAVLRCEI